MKTFVGRLSIAITMVVGIGSLLLVLLPVKALAQVTQEWVTRYNGPGNRDDFANALAVDGSGNVYVTGRSFGSGSYYYYYDYATVKYDANGNPLWVARYNGPANSIDSAYALAVDGSGNVYVTGSSLGSGSDFDYATVKYDANGNPLWVARYNGPGNGGDGANTLAVDGSGNVYVTGQSYDSGSIQDYATVKYDANGNPLWVARYNGPANSIDSTYTLAVDGSGNVYVTGSSLGSGNNFDYATIKYSQAGGSTPSAELPRTGQTTCYDSAGTIISCAGTGQDGDIKAGVAWPSPRFTDNGDGTVTDNLTGLTWTKDGGTPTVGACTGGAKTWQGALDYVACLNTNSYLGHADWRLPNVNELESLNNAEAASPATYLNGQGFTNVQPTYYWSSTSYAFDTATAWVAEMEGGEVVPDYNKTLYFFFVWPVRATSTPPAQLWKTGQTACYDASGSVIACAGSGQDGDIQAGVSWPSPRFTDNGDGTVTDNLTGLMWLKDANCFGTRTWQGALDTVADFNTTPTNYNCADYDESNPPYTDWRLPNRKELHSLTDFNNITPTLPPAHPFLNVQGAYWSSTSYAGNAALGWLVSMVNGGVFGGGFDKEAFGSSVWPVRAGSFTLTLSTAGTGSGTVSGGGTYNYGQTATVSALADAGSTFDGWTGPDAAECATGSVLMNANKSCTANFTLLASQPDLIMTAATPNAATVNAGATLSVTDTVQNQGLVASGSFRIGYRLSLNTVYGDSDDVVISTVRVVTGPFAAGASSTATTSLSIPSTTPGGTYYLCALADSVYQVAESDETNNTLCSASTVTVPLPDLIISAISTGATTVTKGNKFSLSFRITNQGGSKAGSFVTGFHLSTDANYGGGDDIPMSGTLSLPSLGAGASFSKSLYLVVPSTTPSGTYYVCGMTDTGLTVAESDEGNNTNCTGTTITVP